MLLLLPIASGSTGNCMLVDLDGHRILIDLGVTAKALSAALGANGYGWDDIDAVLISHSHSDHVKGLEVCMKRISAPIYTSGTTRDTLMLDRALILPYTEKVEILPGIRVTAIRTSHDCPGSVGFLIESANCRLGYLTDLGVIPESTMELLFGCDCIVIESNHDEQMLRYGRYPVHLKRRILSDHGHLSNVDASSEPGKQSPLPGPGLCPQGNGRDGCFHPGSSRLRHRNRHRILTDGRRHRNCN